MPSSFNLYKKAIVWSAPAIPYRSLENALKVYQHASRQLRCSPTDEVCLQSKTAQEIIDATYGDNNLSEWYNCG